MLKYNIVGETADYRNKCMKYISMRDLKKIVSMQERGILCGEDYDNMVGRMINEVDLMCMLQIKGKHIWEKEKIFGKKY